MASVELSYYYGYEAEQFSFYHELVCSATLRSAQILNISAH